MLRALNTNAEHVAAQDRVREWTRARFRLGDDVAILVAQVSCGVPGCPPVETVVAFWIADTRHQFKVFKPVVEVTLADLPPSWMKNALVATDGMECGCC
jgi:hypothetical protein